MPAGADAAPANPVTHAVASAVRVILGLLLLGMVALNVANALCRYLLGVVLTGADEILVFTMIWMVMVGMIVATANQSHIALDFLVTRIGPRPSIVLSILHHAVMTCACAYAAFYCWSFVARVAALGQASMALGLPMAIPHFALVVGFAGTTIASALLLVSDISRLMRPRAGGR